MKRSFHPWRGSAVPVAQWRLCSGYAAWSGKHEQSSIETVASKKSSRLVHLALINISSGGVAAPVAPLDEATPPDLSSICGEPSNMLTGNVC